jgi:hypothetical protein
MSLKSSTLRSAVVAVVVSVAIIAASFAYIGIPAPLTGTTNSSAASQSGQYAPLSIRLTDPPQVPSLTTSLNLTYSSIELLVGEPTGTAGQFETQTVTVTPSGGSATLDLLKLENVSQTIAVASLPNGSVLYSVTFNVTGIKIDVNGTVSDVALSTGSTTFEVTIAHPTVFGSGDFALLQLNPVVVNTPSGYELIPSSVGVMGHGEGSDQVGDRHQLTISDNSSLGSARGNVSSSITALSVSGNITTFSVLVNNSANLPVDLVGVGLHGNFTVFGSGCLIFTQQHNQDSGDTPQTQSTHDQCELPLHINEVVFIPVSLSMPSGSSCATGQMVMVNGPQAVSAFHKITISPGQCVVLTFVGQISFGDGHLTLVPSTTAGQVYVLHTIASNGANQLVTCTLPLNATSCGVLGNQDSRDW